MADATAGKLNDSIAREICFGGKTSEYDVIENLGDVTVDDLTSYRRPRVPDGMVVTLDIYGE